jgi:hypothetical protein
LDEWEYGLVLFSGEEWFEGIISAGTEGVN